jgi:N-acetylglucosamine-6-phosphate deacetylase
MMPLLLKNVHLYVPEPLSPGSVLIEGGKIVAVYKMGETTPDVKVMDLGGAALGPGFIDVHTHGGDRVELMDGGDAAARLARFFARHGVTGFLPTTLTASLEDTAEAVESARQAMVNPTGGARVLGVHLEGPFVSPERLGAQSPDFCIPPTAENVARLLKVAGDMARIVTMAPEEEGGIEAVKTFTEHGVIVSVGHTVATAEQAMAAFAAGAREATHLFNGMQPMHHRQPGVVGAVLTTKGVMAEIIADGVHLAPTTIRLVVAAKGIDGVLLITDSMAATGCEDGEYILGPMKVYVRNGQARLQSGSLAGSTLTLDRAVVNVARWTDVGLGSAWQMASLNPARQLGIDDYVGQIAPGYDADLTAMNGSGQVVMTMVGGEVVYQA